MQTMTLTTRLTSILKSITSLKALAYSWLKRKVRMSSTKLFRQNKAKIGVIQMNKTFQNDSKFTGFVY